MAKKCPTCGAVLAISPEDLVISCAYCGETMDVDGKKIPNHQMLPSMDTNTVRGNVLQFLKKNRISEGASIDELKAVYLPWWGVPFESDTHYFGVAQSSVQRQKTETYKDAEGNVRTRTVTYSVTVYKPEEGDFHRTGRENVIARKHTAFYGFDKFQDTIFLDNIQPFDFNHVKQHNAEFINAEVDAGEAQRDAFGRVENENRSIAAGKVYKLVRCDSNIRVDYPVYVHASLWQARYKFQGKSYKVSAAGDTGKVVKGEVPLTLGRRIFNLSIGLALMLVFAYVAQLGYDAFQGPDQEWGIIVMIIGLVVMGISFAFSQTAFRTQLEKSDKISRPKKQKGGK